MRDDYESGQAGPGPNLPGTDYPSIQTIERTVGSIPAAIVSCLREVSQSLFSIRCRSPWLTVIEAERYCRVRRGVVREAVLAGEIEGYRRTTGSSIIVRVADVDHWIERTWPASTNGFAEAAS